MIDSFAGRYRFLSNFYPSPIYVAELDFPTVEHAYQALKTPVADIRRAIAEIPTPGGAKRYGQRIPIRPDWEAVKVGTMEALLVLKFGGHPDLAARLLATGEHELIEGNTWGDRFWGVYKGEGRNELGKALMRVRAHLRRRP